MRFERVIKPVLPALLVAISVCASLAPARGDDDATPPPASNAVVTKKNVLELPNLKAAPKDIVTELILDASGSMKQKVHQRTKLFQAKRVLRAFMVQAQNESMMLGLRVFGLKEKDCKSSDLVYDFGQQGADAIDAAMQATNPKGYGKTPLEYSLRLAEKDLLKHPDKPKRIILVSDGIDTCGGDPCKIAKELQEKLDIRIFVVGYGLSPEEHEKLKCLTDGGGDFFDENDLQGLIDALKSLQDHDKNLIVKSPDPLGVSELYEVLPDKPPHKVGSFISSLGTHVEPNKEYQVRVLLKPVYTFEKVIVAPKEVKILVVNGLGTVTIGFKDQLFSITLLDEHGTPVKSFPSDVATKVPVGSYKVQATSPPFADTMIDDIEVTPGGNYEEKIAGFGAIQLDPPSERAFGPYGYYVFDDIKKKDLGSYLTGVPLVLQDGRYLIKTVGNAILKNVYPAISDVLHIPIPPPGQIVTFTRREKPDENEPKGPVFLHEMSVQKLQEHLKGLENHP